MEEAFLSPRADDLFVSVAAFGDAEELQAIDVTQSHSKARHAIKTAIHAGLRHSPSPGARIALIKGLAGSGKSHILTTTFKQASSAAVGEIYPAVLQLTAPVTQADYEKWLLDATFRQLLARHFADDSNRSPLRRLADRLLEHTTSDERNEYYRLIEDVEDDGEIPLAKRFALRIRQEAQSLLKEDPPSAAFLATILLAGFGDWSAITYLRHGDIDERISPLQLRPIKTPHDRLSVLADLGSAAQMAGACLALGFDQVENAVRLGDEGLFTHTLVQAVRIAEGIPNCAIAIAVIADEYDDIVGGTRDGPGLPISDRDRIERERPRAVMLDLGSPQFRQEVVSRRLGVLRERANKLSGGAIETPLMAPLPAWFLPRIDAARSVRLALREVSMFRESGLDLGHLPSQSEYEGDLGDATPVGNPDDVIDFDKLWQDHLDRGGATLAKILPSKKAELLAWWIKAASQEHRAADPAEVTATMLDDAAQTNVIDVVMKAKGIPVERRQIGLCEAANRHGQLRDQIESFAEFSTGTPFILRTNGFPKGRTAQAAGAIRLVLSMQGAQVDISDTEWNNLQHADDFASEHENDPGFLSWRRDRQWLRQLLSPLAPLIEMPELFKPAEGDVISADALGMSEQNGASKPAPEAALEIDPEQAVSSGVGQNATQQSKEAETVVLREHTTERLSAVNNATFPVFIGKDDRGQDVLWDPYREAPHHLNNFGFLVTGDAGSGKTQTIKILIDAAARSSLSVCIFDFKADYCDPEFVDPLGIKVIDIGLGGLPFNPLQPPPHGASGAQPIRHVHELAGILGRLFKLGAVQQGLLREAISCAYEASGISLSEWVQTETTSWPSFDAVMDQLSDEPKAASIVTKLSLMTDLGLLGNTGGKAESFADFIDARVSLKMSDLPTDEVKAAIAELIIIQLHGHALRGDQPRRLKRMLVFDEAHRVRGSARLETLAREGRAFGIGTVIGTQFPGDIPETMAGNLATQLFLMNGMADHRRYIVKQMFGSGASQDAKELMGRLGDFKPFDGLFSNSHHQRAIVEILPYYKR